MERSFYNEDFDFEELIRQKSDQYKLYPSDKVWRGINQSLHPNRKWYWLSLVLFLGGISYYTADQLNTPSHKIAGTNKASQSVDKEANQQAIVLPFTPPGDIAKTRVSRKTYDKKGLVVVMSEIQLKEEMIESPNANGSTSIDEASSTSIENTIKETTIAVKPTASAIADKEFVKSVITAADLDVFASLATTKPAVADKLAEDNVEINDEITSTSLEAADEKRVNWLHENAVYELTAPKLKRVSWQVYASPTMNYRKLVGDNDANIASDSKNIPIALNIQGDVDKLVNHKPGLGFEIGSMLMYAMNKNVTFKTGVQFNFSRYNIQAYSARSTERATIALSNFYSPSADSITSFTRLRNFGGSAEKGLENKYYELSAPIGVDVLVLGRGRLQISVGGTVQPTYLINRNNYLITTDYKNYTHEPSLVRRWNVNTSAEAFISYKAAGFKFQVGPQFRYQLFSTYKDKYPIHEFLMEYGLKLGVSKTFR